MAPAAATGNQDVRPQVSVRAAPAPDMPCPPHAPRKPRTTCPLPLLHFLPALGTVHLLQSWAQGLLGPPPSIACRQHPCSGLVIHPQLNVMLIGAKKPPRGQGLGSACFLSSNTHISASWCPAWEGGCYWTPSRLLSSAWPLHTETWVLAQAWPGRGPALVAFKGGAG